jgi:FKBP-type peptidyl-prolyl cis-trans isomerase SlpA
MKINEKKTITISKEEAYGESREDLIQEVDKSQLPEDITPEVEWDLYLNLLTETK